MCRQQLRNSFASTDNGRSILTSKFFRWLSQLAGVILLLLLTSQCAIAQARENADYCRSNGRLVLLLVDATTPYDQTDKDVIVRLTDEILSSTQKGDRIVIRTIVDSYTRSERLIDRCMPGCFESGTFGKLFRCSDGVIKTDQLAVREGVVSSLRKRLLKFEELQYSDIVRTVHYAVKEEVREGQGLSLYVYSDLIEHSDYFVIQYILDYPLKRLLDGVKHYKLVAPLGNADVHVSGVGRDGTPQRRPLPIAKLNKLVEFWRAYFELSGAKSVSITPDVIKSGR